MSGPLPILSCLALLAAALPAAEPVLTSDHKPWTRWWWPGSAVDEANLSRELETLAAAGFGGVEITPIYAMSGTGDRAIPFLSERYVAMLAHTCREAARLGLRVDMATGTGWPFGGPQVGAADADRQMAVVDGRLQVKPTGQGVKRAAPGGAGPVLNPYAAAGLVRYLEPFTRALAVLPPGSLRCQFHDSFEYKGNWCDELPARFQVLHGYDLREHLPALGGAGDADTVARIKADYRSTLDDLHLGWLRTWTDWAHGRGELTRNQAHGAPGNLLDLYAAADIPETELFGAQAYPIPGLRREAGDLAPDPHPPVLHRLASSAAHVAGRRLASAETFTWLREHFREAPSQMKPEVDQLLLTGINHLFHHGTAYSPADAPWPGWLFYAATQANSRNPLWDDLAALNGYIARCQAVLQAGAPDNDILLYWPVADLWHEQKGLQRRLSAHAHDWLSPTPAGMVAETLVATGHAFDFISDRQLQETRATVDALQTGGGTYRTLLIPRTGHLPVPTMERIIALIETGATVLFHDALPADVPGHGALDQRRQQLKALLARLAFADADAAGVRHARLGAGRACLAASLPALLSAAAVSREPMADHGLGVVRRRLEHGHAYFIANLSAIAVDAWMGLGRPALAVLLRDPLSGRSGAAALRQTPRGAELRLALRPGESLLLETGAAAPGTPAWTYHAAGPAAVPLTGTWRLRFLRGGPALPAPRTMTELRSWADAPDGEAQEFAGTARYELDFDLPPGMAPAAWRLDLGTVRETARVAINGVAVGHAWSLPCDLLVDVPLRATGNLLSVEVTNGAANRIRGLDRRDPSWRKGMHLVTIAYQPFDAASWPLQPAGLLGPVRLVRLSGSTAP